MADQDPIGAPRSRSAARQKILAAADRLFYGEGIRAVGVDRLVAEAQVTRVTFYRHFPSKDHLIAAYLAGRLERDREQLDALRRTNPSDPHAVLVELAANLAADTASPGFRGCPYANLTSEYSDAQHPARDVAGQHRRWLLGEVEQLLTELGADEPDIVAEQLVMLRAGAMAVCSVANPENVPTAFTAAWLGLIERSLETPNRD